MKQDFPENLAVFVVDVWSAAGLVNILNQLADQGFAALAFIVYQNFFTRLQVAGIVDEQSGKFFNPPPDVVFNRYIIPRFDAKKVLRKSDKEAATIDLYVKKQ